MPIRFGWPPGWQTEFACVYFRGERWEERNIKTLYNRIFHWLWEHRREDVLQWIRNTGEGPIAGPDHPPGRWDRLGDDHYLQMGLFYRYLLGDIKDVLQELDLADQVDIVYAYADE